MCGFADNFLFVKCLIMNKDAINKNSGLKLSFEF